MLPTIMNRGPIDPWTRTPRSIAPFSAAAPSHHSLSSADFITNIAESNFRYTQGQADCLGLFQAAQGTRTLDLAAVGEQGRRTRHCRSCQRQHDRACAQKNILQPHRRQHWVIPPKANSAFVAAMEDVLAVYTRPRDGDCRLVCLDETSKQLNPETRVPMPMKAGRPARAGDDDE